VPQTATLGLNSGVKMTWVHVDKAKRRTRNLQLPIKWYTAGYYRLILTSAVCIPMIQCSDFYIFNMKFLLYLNFSPWRHKMELKLHALVPRAVWWWVTTPTFHLSASVELDVTQNRSGRGSKERFCNSYRNSRPNDQPVVSHLLTELS